MAWHSQSPSCRPLYLKKTKKNPNPLKEKNNILLISKSSHQLKLPVSSVTEFICDVLMCISMFPASRKDSDQYPFVALKYYLEMQRLQGIYSMLILISTLLRLTSLSDPKEKFMECADKLPTYGYSYFFNVHETDEDLGSLWEKSQKMQDF